MQKQKKTKDKCIAINNSCTDLEVGISCWSLFFLFSLSFVCRCLIILSFHVNVRECSMRGKEETLSLINDHRQHQERHHHHHRRHQMLPQDFLSPFLSSRSKRETRQDEEVGRSRVMSRKETRQSLNPPPPHSSCPAAFPCLSHIQTCNIIPCLSFSLSLTLLFLSCITYNIMHLQRRRKRKENHILHRISFL